MPIDRPPYDLSRAQNMPVAPNFEQIMRQADETPFPTDVVQAAQ